MNEIRHITARLLLALVAVTVCCAATPVVNLRVGPALPPTSSAQDNGTDQRVKALIAEGREALERGDERAARASFERALSISPQDVAANTYLGILDDRAGDLKGAEKHFAAAAIAAPFSPSAHNNYGAFLARTGRTDLAAAQFEKSLKLNPDQPNALVNLAQVRFASGKTEDLRVALELFERAQTLAPDAEVARALVVTALRLGEKQKAASGYHAYAEQLGRQNAPLPTAASRAELGQALLEAGLADEAIEELRAAVAQDASNVPAVVALGRAHLARGDIREAGRTLESAVARGLDAAPIYAALAEVYDRAGYIENAIPAMRLAIARDPANEKYHLRYGLLLTDSKAPGAAIIRLQEAVKEFPNSSRLWLALGIAELNDGKSDDAQKSFERSLELDPKAVPALAYLGFTYAERGQYDEAIKFYERAISADANLAAPYYLTADVMLKRTDFDQPRVEKLLRRAIELDPSFASAHLALARLHARAGRLTDAASEFEQVIKLNPESAEAHYQLGRVYTQLKRAADAQRELALFQQLKETQKQGEEKERRDLVRRLANVRF
jgi:tetratricopeptide (TPR) repeat protein